MEIAKIPYLPKLLLQDDLNPSSDHKQLIEKAQQGKILCCSRPNKSAIAIACGRRLVIITWDSQSHPTPHFTNINTSPPQYVTALAWISSSPSPSTSNHTATECLLIGTSTGSLQIRSPSNATLLHSLILHDSPVKSIYHRTTTITKSSLHPPSQRHHHHHHQFTTSEDDVSIGYGDAVVRIPSYDIWAMVKWYEIYPQHQHNNNSSGAPVPSISKWILGGLKTTKNNNSTKGSRTFAACIGSPEPSLYSVLTQRQQQYHNNSKVWIFTAGSGPPLAGYEGTEKVVPGIFSLWSGIAGSTASSVMEQARGSLFGRAVSRFSSAAASAASAASSGSGNDKKGNNSTTSGRGKGEENILLDDNDDNNDDDETKRKKKAMLKELLPPATTLSKPCTAFDDDDKRRITSVSVSDCGTWASCCDSLGRILLVDTSSMVVVRVMKGYRDAQAVWMVGVGGGEKKKGRLLLLVVYAPRRGVVEVWDAVNGVRVSSKQIDSMHGLLIQEQCWFLDLDNLRILKLDGGGGGGG